MCVKVTSFLVYDITITHILTSDRNIFSKKKYVSTSPSPCAHFGERNLFLSRIRRSNRIKRQVREFFVEQKGSRAGRSGGGDWDVRFDGEADEPCPCHFSNLERVDASSESETPAVGKAIIRSLDLDGAVARPRRGTPVWWSARWMASTPPQHKWRAQLLLVFANGRRLSWCYADQSSVGLQEASRDPPTTRTRLTTGTRMSRPMV